MIDVEELERLEKARTQGEWRSDYERLYVKHIGEAMSVNMQSDGLGIAESCANAAFIAFLANNASSILSELKRGREYKKALEWRPIESAPEYERVLVGWFTSERFAGHSELGVRKWKGGETVWVNTYDNPFSGAPDCWMPFPEPPTALQDQTNG